MNILIDSNNNGIKPHFETSAGFLILHRASFAGDPSSGLRRFLDDVMRGYSIKSYKPCQEKLKANWKHFVRDDVGSYRKTYDT